jgi:hypothetical protein
VTASPDLTVAQQFNADISRRLDKVMRGVRGDRHRAVDPDEHLLVTAQTLTSLTKPELANLLAAAITRLIDQEK